MPANQQIISIPKNPEHHVQNNAIYPYYSEIVVKVQ
jgi:hypothetical protein